MIKLHKAILSTNETDLHNFLAHVEKLNIEGKLFCYVVAFQDGEPLYIRQYGEFIRDPKGPADEILTYDGLTGIKCYGGTGLALFDKGEETNLSCFNKTAIKAWTKANWKEGILVDWTKISVPVVEEGAMQATRDSYDWK